MTVKLYQPTQAVLDNIERAIAISDRYPRESYVAKQRLQQVELAKSVKFDIKTISNMYHSLTKLEKGLDFNKKLWDGGCDDNVMTYYALGGKSGLAWSKSILKAEGILVSDRSEVTKAQMEEQGSDNVGTLAVLKAVELEKRLATFVILEAQDDDGLTTDLHADTYTADEIEKAAHSFNMECRKANLFHRMETTSFEFRESYIAPVDFVINGQFVKKGSWLGVIYVSDDEIWEGIKSGEYNGLSIQCMANVEYID